MKRSTTAPPPRVPYPQTPATAREWIRANGVCVADLARTHQVPRAVLVDLLRGQLKGHRGVAHHGAIALGLKPQPKGAAA
jgi:gp16 family phage-associated protein